VTTTKDEPLLHGGPATEKGFVGVAVKQKAAGWNTTTVEQNKIAKGEKYFLITKGIVQVPEVAGFAVGDPIYIIAAENKLTETVGSNLKFGRVVEIENERGTPANKVRIDLDAKDSF
jgi:hypothetical protein